MKFKSTIRRIPVPMNIMKMIQDAASGEGETRQTMLEYIDGQIAGLTKRVELMKKAREELIAVGADKMERIITMVRHNHDPDGPVEKVGPHGAGCECPPEDDNLGDEDEEPTVN
jgi:hypothetical protein